MFEAIPKIRIFINFLLIVQICLGIAIIAFAWFHQKLLATFLTETEQTMLSSKFFNAYILGFQLSVSFLCALIMWSNIWTRRYSENIELLLRVWLIFCFLIVICGGAIIWSLYNSADTLAEGAEIILLKGIDNYYMNPEWKLLWDKLQYTKECCGVHNYMDWMHAEWIHEDDLMDTQQYEQDVYDVSECIPLYLDLDVNDREETIKQQPQILAPYACCKRDSKFCYENYVPRKKKSVRSPNNLPHLNLTDINTQGCFPLFTKHLKVALDTLFLLILIAVVVNIILCCLTKYLMATNYTRSYREFYNDMCMYDDEGNALVVIKCPPKVKCITLEEPNTFSGSDIPNLVSSADMCQCCEHYNNDDGDATKAADSGKDFNEKRKKNLYFEH
ncbi:tetraspanin 33B [Cochliomyia hominivorax]